MAATYNNTLPTARDRIRFALGDTDMDDPLLTNEEITAVLADNDSEEDDTIIALAEGLAARFARRVTMSVDGMSVQYSDLSRRYSELASKMRSQMRESAGIGSPSVHGVSVSVMDGVDSDMDRVPNQFKIGMHDNPQGRSGDQSETEL